MARTCSHRNTFSTTRPSLTSVRVFARESWFTIYILIEISFFQMMSIKRYNFKLCFTLNCYFWSYPRLQSREKNKLARLSTSVKDISGDSSKATYWYTENQSGCYKLDCHNMQWADWLTGHNASLDCSGKS